MPLRASNKDVSAAVGRMIFGNQSSSKAIERRLSAVPPEKWQKALQRQGLQGTSVEKISHALSGKDRAGLSKGEVKRVVAALQDTGIASSEQGAGHLVLTAARRAQERAATGPVLSSEQQKQKMKVLAQERRKEANAEALAGQAAPVSVLERMRGSRGGVQGAVSPEDEQEAAQQMKLAPKIKLPPPKAKGEDKPNSFFQA